MIDEKTIKRAAQEYNPINDMLGEEARASFKNGVEWFKENLWHTKDEIPEADRLILVKDWKCKDGYFLFDTTEDLSLQDFDKKSQWESLCKFADLDFAWCYIDDLLPEEGGR